MKVIAPEPWGNGMRTIRLLCGLGLLLLTYTAANGQSAPTIATEHEQVPATITDPGTAHTMGETDKLSCAGEYTRCVAVINDPQHNNQMTVRNGGTSAPSCDALARRCRSDVGTTYFYSSPVLICAPYVACDAY